MVTVEYQDVCSRAVLVAVTSVRVQIVQFSVHSHADALNISNTCVQMY
jgi:hypothetical protein